MASFSLKTAPTCIFRTVSLITVDRKRSYGGIGGAVATQAKSTELIDPKHPIYNFLNAQSLLITGAYPEISERGGGGRSYARVK